MVLNKEIPKKDLDKIKMVVFDSDGVTIPRGTKIQETVTPESISVHAETKVIQPHIVQLIKLLRERVVVAFSSGRALLYLQSMYGPILGHNTILQAENGNVSLIEGALVQHEKYDEEYFMTLSKIRDDARKLPIKGVEPKQFILSIHAEGELQGVYEVVKEYDKKNELKVMWNGEAFDIQRKNISKASGLKALADHLNIQIENVLAIGDRVNDKEMLEVAGIGVSADRGGVEAEYWTEGDKLPGEILAEYLVEKFGL